MPIIAAIMILALPIAEIAVFILVGSNLGVLATIGLIFAASAAGALLLRVQGFGALSKMRVAMERGEAVGREIADGLMIALAGLLLITPGFITGTLGLLLFIPPVRQLFWKLAGLRLAVVVARRGGPDPDIVDLGPNEYRRQPRGRIDSGG